MSSLQLVLCLVLIGFSALLSAAEIALFSLCKFQIRALKDRARGSYRFVKKLLGDPGGVLGTILISNEVINISLSAIISHGLAREEDLASRFTLLTKGWLAIPHWLIQTLAGVLVITP